MPLARVASPSPLLQRACLTCGYRGEELQRAGDRASYHCPGCGQDLYARPPRSYAEMEGLHTLLVAHALRAHPQRLGAGPRVGRLLRIWRRLAGFFVRHVLWWRTHSRRASAARALPVHAPRPRPAPPRR